MVGPCTCRNVDKVFIYNNSNFDSIFIVSSASTFALAQILIPVPPYAFISAINLLKRYKDEDV